MYALLFIILIFNLSSLHSLANYSISHINTSLLTLMLLGYATNTMQQGWGAINTNKRAIGGVAWSQRARSVTECMAACLSKFISSCGIGLNED